MINLPLRHIQSLVGLAETGSFHAAAARLGISQPAVSAHIRALEDAVGVPLVHRTTRHVALTPEGKAYVARAVRAFNDLALATRDLHDLKAAQRGEVAVACIPPLMSHVMPRVVRALEARHPAIEVRLRDVMSRELDGVVGRGEAEIGIGPRHAGSALAFERLKRDDFVAVVPRQHPLAARRRIALADLAAWPIIANSRDTNARQIIDRALQRLSQPVTPRFELIHYFTVGRFVEAGLGVTVLPRMACEAIASDRLVVLELTTPRLAREIGLMSRRGYRPAPAAAVFIAALRRALGATSSVPGNTQPI